LANLPGSPGQHRLLPVMEIHARARELFRVVT
jgi:hypothetical protein